MTGSGTVAARAAASAVDRAPRHRAPALPHRWGARLPDASTLGGVVSLAVAVLLFTRFGFSGTLSRDEAVYTYGGQQVAAGVPPYASVFDPKTPMATLLAGVAALLARVTGLDDVTLIRVAYFVCSCLTVLATYLLATRLWHSQLAGVAAAVVLASFRGFAMDAASGPDAKTPGLLLVVVAMLMLVERRWFWAAFCGSCALLVWQPFAAYAAVAVLLAAAGSTRATKRLRRVGAALAGAVLPVLLTVAYFASTGALALLLEATVLFPLQGINRGTEPLHDRLPRIAEVVTRYYGPSGVLVWVGLVALLAIAGTRLRRGPLGAALRDSLVCVVSSTLLVQLVYAATDFQSYPDVFPFLPYAAIGVAGVVAAVVRRQVEGGHARRGVPAVVVMLGLLTIFSAVSFTRDPSNNDGLREQELQACALDRLLPRDAALYALGDPTPLVLTHRRNVDRFILVSSGLAEWKMARLPGSFDGWLAQIEQADPWVVVSPSRLPRDVTGSISLWLRQHGYHRLHVGRWPVYVDRRALDRAREQGIGLRRFRSTVPTEPAAQGGQPLTRAVCNPTAKVS